MRTLCLAILSISTTLGCSVITDVAGTQCSTNLDCTNRGAAFTDTYCIDSMCVANPKWSCAANPTEQPAQPAVSDALLTVRGFMAKTPVSGVHASVFGAFDFNLTQVMSSGYTNSQGQVTLSVPEYYDGLITLEAEDVIDPTLYYPNLPVTAATGLGTADVGMVGDKNYLITVLLKTAPAADCGLLMWQILDCQNNGAEGVTFLYEGNMEGTTQFYTFGGVASSTATATDNTGNGGVINVKPGIIGIDAQVNGKSVANTSVLIRQGYSTWVTLLVGRPTVRKLHGD